MQDHPAFRGPADLEFRKRVDDSLFNRNAEVNRSVKDKVGTVTFRRLRLSDVGFKFEVFFQSSGTAGFMGLAPAGMPFLLWEPPKDDRGNRYEIWFSGGGGSADTFFERNFNGGPAIDHPLLVSSSPSLVSNGSTAESRELDQDRTLLGSLISHSGEPDG